MQKQDQLQGSFETSARENENFNVNQGFLNAYKLVTAVNSDPNASQRRTASLEHQITLKTRFSYEEEKKLQLSKDPSVIVPENKRKSVISDQSVISGLKFNMLQSQLKLAKKVSTNLNESWK